MLARELDKTHPSAANSLREGLTETLTVLALDVPPTLARTLRSTNPIESMIGICRERSKNVKRWRDGRCTGARPGCSRPGASSAASTATCTYPHSEPHSTVMSPNRLSVPSVMMRP